MIRTAYALGGSLIYRSGKNLFNMYKSIKTLNFLYIIYSQSSKDYTKTLAGRMEPSDTSVKFSTEEK